MNKMYKGSFSQFYLIFKKYICDFTLQIAATLDTT